VPPSIAGKTDFVSLRAGYGGDYADQDNAQFERFVQEAEGFIRLTVPCFLRFCFYVFLLLIKEGSPYGIHKMILLHSEIFTCYSFLSTYKTKR